MQHPPPGWPPGQFPPNPMMAPPMMMMPPMMPPTGPVGCKLSSNISLLMIVFF